MEIEKTQNKEILTKRHRGWIFTENNYDVNVLSKIKNLPNTCKSLRYIVVGKEVGKEGTPHLQGYVEFDNPRFLNGVKKELGLNGWVWPRLASAKQAADYCKKDGDLLIEFGDCPQGQGDRSDLKELALRIKSGEKVINIRQENPNIYHQYGRTLEKLEEDILLMKERYWKTECIWIKGKTGVGKTYIIMKAINKRKYYNKTFSKDTDWWDNYIQQEIVLFNDFRGEMGYSKMLLLLDEYPMEVSRRCKTPMPFTSKLVVITAPQGPEYYYDIGKGDDITQLLRRIEVIEFKSKEDQILFKPWEEKINKIYSESDVHKCTEVPKCNNEHDENKNILS